MFMESIDVGWRPRALRQGCSANIKGISTKAFGQLATYKVIR